MEDKGKTKDLLPDSFESEEAAGEFWDSHSLMDYQEHLEATDHTNEISERVFEIQLPKMYSRSYGNKQLYFISPFRQLWTKLCERNLPRNSRISKF